MSAFHWKEGTRAKVSADVAGEVCKGLEEKGLLTPKNLVAVSRDEEAPLHKEFEWDDAVAAECYRESQASYIIRHLEVTVQTDDEPQPVRAFFSVEPVKAYQKVETLLMKADSRQALLSKALSELKAFKLKYACLEELAEIFEKIDELRES